jgi:cyanate lyase
MTYQSTLPRTTLTDLISEAQARLNKTDEQFAKELGFERASVFTMIRAGTMKLPIDKVQALAKAIDYPAADVLRVTRACDRRTG